MIKSDLQEFFVKLQMKISRKYPFVMNFDFKSKEVSEILEIKS